MSLCSCTGIKSLSFTKPTKNDTSAPLIVKPQKNLNKSSSKLKKIETNDQNQTKDSENKKQPKAKEPGIQPNENKEPGIQPNENKEPGIQPNENKEPGIQPNENKEPKKNSGLKPKLPEREAIIPPK